MPDNPKLTTSDIEASLGVGHANRPSRLRRILLWSLPVMLTIAGWLYWSNGSQTPATRYIAKDVIRGSLTVQVTATGNLEPTNQVEVGTEVSGTIASVDVDYNDAIEVGEVLARLDTSKLDAQAQQSRAALASAEAKVLTAQANVAEAKSELARLRKVRELSGGKTPSQSDLDTAEATLKRNQADEASAKASVSQAKATLALNETDLKKAVVRSPISGVVLNRSVDPGQTVAASLQAPVLFTLAEDLAKMELHVYVDEADVGQVREGQDATFTVDAYPERTFPAKITQVRFGSEEVDGVITYETLLSLDNSDLSLRPGMTATAEITVKHIDDAVLIPNAALRFSPPKSQTEQSDQGGGTLLFRIFPRPPQPENNRKDNAEASGSQKIWVLRDGAPVAVNVTTGDTDGTHTAITGGDLKPGMQVIVDTQSTGG